MASRGAWSSRRPATEARVVGMRARAGSGRAMPSSMSPGRWLAAALALAAGCAVGPNYKRPEPAGPTPAAFKEPQTSAASAADWKAAQPADPTLRGKWWQLFGDPQLDALEEKIVVSNQTLKAAAAQYLAARDQVRVARAGYYPTLSLGASANHTRDSQNQLGSVPAFNTYAIPLQASWEPDLWGQVRRTVEQARANLDATAADLANVELSLHSELALDYFQLRGLDTQKQLLESTLSSDTDYLHLMQVRFKGGIATEVDVAQAEAQVRNVKAQAGGRGVARAQMEHAIALLIGAKPAGFALPPSTAPLALPKVPAGVPSALLERRPDIAAAERRVAGASAAVGIATAACYA